MLYCWLFDRSLVQIDQHVWAFGFEIGRWVIKGQMPVFANSNKRNVDRSFLNKEARPLALALGVTFPIKKVKGRERERQFAYETFP